MSSKQIGQAFKDVRESRGESQATVVGRAGIPQQHLSLLESGKNATLKTLEAVAKALECRLDVNLIPIPKRKPKKHRD